MHLLRRSLCCVIALLLAATLWLAGCVPVTAPPPPEVNTPLPPSPEQQLREAFGTADPTTRLTNILSATESFLRDAAVRTLSDEEAAAWLTQTVFSADQPALVQVARIRRAGEMVVIALPAGLGLYLYDLSAPIGAPPCEISRWIAGLDTLEVSWGDDEAGVSFTTLGADGLRRPHYALLRREADGVWRTAWFSDEVPDWWFNAVGGMLYAAPDRTQLIVVGEAARTTEAFYEQAGEPRRSFRLVWQRKGDGYVLSPPPQAYSSRQAWLWEVTEPSPYATLVEFVERIQAGDEGGAAQLVSDEAVLAAARDFGLHLAERRYQVVESAAERIVFRDVQTTLVASFQPPREADGKWLITGLAPLGAAPRP